MEKNTLIPVKLEIKKNKKRNVKDGQLKPGDRTYRAGMVQREGRDPHLGISELAVLVLECVKNLGVCHQTVVVNEQAHKIDGNLVELSLAGQSREDLLALLAGDDRVGQEITDLGVCLHQRLPTRHTALSLVWVTSKTQSSVGKVHKLSKWEWRGITSSRRRKRADFLSPFPVGFGGVGLGGWSLVCFSFSNRGLQRSGTRTKAAASTWTECAHSVHPCT
jgi:hypothetical protein